MGPPRTSRSPLTTGFTIPLYAQLEPGDQFVPSSSQSEIMIRRI